MSAVLIRMAAWYTYIEGPETDLAGWYTIVICKLLLLLPNLRHLDLGGVSGITDFSTLYVSRLKHQHHTNNDTTDNKFSKIFRFRRTGHKRYPSPAWKLHQTNRYVQSIARFKGYFSPVFKCERSCCSS